MAAFLIDLDDTLVIHKSTTLLPGALEMLKSIKAKGHQLFLTTRRGDDWSYPHVYSKRATEEFIKTLDVKFDGIIFNVDSPRIVINDSGAVAINHPARTPLDCEIGDDDSPIEPKS